MYIGHSLFLLLSFINLYISIAININVNIKYLYGLISHDKHCIVGIIDIILIINVVSVIELYFDSCFSMFIFLYISDSINSPMK